MKIDGIDLSDLSKFPTTITVGELKKLREKAEKWDKIAQITSGEDRCTICIIGNKCDEPEEWEGLPCEILRHIIKALEGESHGRTRHNP